MYPSDGMGRSSMPKALALCMVLTALSLLAGAVEGSSASGSVSSVEPAALSGAVEAAMPAGLARVDDAKATEVVLVHGATGTLTFSSVSGPHARSPFSDPKVATRSSSQDYALDNATLTLVLSGEPLAAVLDGAAGGTVLARADVDGAGLPRVLESDYNGRDDANGTLAQGPSPPDWVWRAGWQMVGNLTRLGGFTGFPLEKGATLDARGAVMVYLMGGNLSFVDASGNPVTLPLGDMPGDLPSVPLPSERLGAGDDRVQWVVFHGVVSDASLPARASWGLSGPEASWALNGTATLRHASGEIAGHGFQDQPVSIEGSLLLAPTLPAHPVAGVTQVEYAVSGEATSLTIGGEGVETGPAAPAWERPAEVGAVSVAGLLLAYFLGGLGLAGRVAAPLYTRISPSRLLDHPTRRRIHELAAERPGLHLRELHRLVGGAWGPLQFHLGLLVQAGIVTLSRAGRYRVVHAGPSKPPGAVGPVHPHAQSVLDALPADGRAVGVADLAEALGLSRQLVGHHVSMLERRGLIVVTTAGAGRRLVARAQASGAAA